MGSTLKGKNLLQRNKFFPLRVDPHIEGRLKKKMVVLLLLKIYLFTFVYKSS